MIIWQKICEKKFWENFFSKKFFSLKFFLDAEKPILRQKKKFGEIFFCQIFFRQPTNHLSNGDGNIPKFGPEDNILVYCPPNVTIYCFKSSSDAQPVWTVWTCFWNIVAKSRRNVSKASWTLILNRLLKQCGEIFSPIVSKVCSIWSVDANFKLAWTVFWNNRRPIRCFKSTVDAQLS